MSLRRTLTITTLLAAGALCASASAQQSDGLMPQGELPSDVDLPQEQGLEVEQKLDAQLPADLEFTNADGKVVKFGEMFDGKHPVLLTFNYSDCPMLCSVQLQDLCQTLENVELEPAKDYRVVTVLIDPLETWKKARITKNKWVQTLAKPTGEAGWDFLVAKETGKEREIRALADAAGFKYRVNPENGQYLHRAVTLVVTPTGKISRYFAELNAEPKEFQRALVQAADGKIGSLTDILFLFCFHYVPAESRYTLFATNLMKAGGVAMVLALGTYLFFMFRHEKARPTC